MMNQHNVMGCARGAGRVEARGGFSLLEMLIVVAIMGLIATLVLTKIGGVFGKSQVKITKAQLEIASHAVERFKLDMNRYPTQEEGLAVLITAPANASGWDGPYFDKETLPKDGWGNPLIYERDSSGSGWAFRIKSYGADGKPGGEGEDADLDSRK